MKSRAGYQLFKELGKMHLPGPFLCSRGYLRLLASSSPVNCGDFGTIRHFQDLDVSQRVIYDGVNFCKKIVDLA